MRKLSLFAVLLSLFSIRNSSGQQHHDVVISEIMADPSPSAGLPEAEYLELYNRTDKVIFLKNWRLAINDRFVTLPDSVILPGAYLLVCHRNNVSLLENYRPLVGVASFNLANDGATITLYNHLNQVVYTVIYKLNQWSSGKRSGGYSLEMIDTENPCGGDENWATSAAKSGGTPGMASSVKGRIADLSAPYVEQVTVSSDKILTLIFNEPLDSINAVRGAIIELAGSKIISRQLSSPSFDNLTLLLDPPLQIGKTYEILIRNLSDCAGNILREAVVKTALPEKAEINDIVISELLFNPKGDGVDYVEIYNRSGKYITLKNWGLGNEKNDEIKIIAKDDLLLPPYGYLAITTEPETVKTQYPSEKTGQYLMVAALPSFPNTAGAVVLKNEAGTVFDHFAYSEEMHSVLITEPGGVSLERIDPDRPASDSKNWQSAASTSGYGTPGYVNSQSVHISSEDMFYIDPEVFAPGQNGSGTFTEIKYAQILSGKVGTIRIFDVSGRLVRNLLQNQLIGTAGEIKWDGTDNHGAIVQTGYYLVLIDTFDVDGNKNQFKKKVVVVSQ